MAGGRLNLLRALTKSYALAGLRLGYCLCGDKSLREKIVAMGQPWPVSYPAQLAGECALQDFPRWPLESARKFAPLREEMARRTSKRKVLQKRGRTERGKYSAKYALSELLVCGECGSGLPSYVRMAYFCLSRAVSVRQGTGGDGGERTQPGGIHRHGDI